MTGKLTRFSLPHLPWQEIIKHGLIAGSISALLCLIGIVTTFHNKALIAGILTMGQVMLLAPIVLYVYFKIQNKQEKPAAGATLITSAILGLIAGAVLAILMFLGQTTAIRNMLVNVSPQLLEIIAFKLAWPLGIVSPLIFGVLAGLIAAGIYLLPARIRYAVTQAILWLIMIGLLSSLILQIISGWGLDFVNDLAEQIFAASGLSILGTIVLLALIGGGSYWRAGRKPASSALDRKAPATRPVAKNKTRQLLILAGIAILLLLLPQILGIFFSEILDNVGIYIIMGLGLNIVIGYAGLLDLGYVAFYAIGAYTMGVLTSPELSAAPLTFWQALPVALLMSVMAGVILGLPVLRMRGDYLAIVTLGFGEIIRILVLSDWLRPWLGGAQGIQGIAQPHIGSLVLDSQQKLYYLILAGIGIVTFIAWRLKDSRLGRSWMALREDEDVAQAMGINLVATKLTAFAMGALFSGLSGAIFSAKLTAAYPNSFSLMVSINVLCLIIVGGMGSIPGVFVGSLALIGLPDLLREFAEFRYWVYGVVLVVMMLLKPEGLWPEERRKLELHVEEEIIPPLDEDTPPVTGSAD